MKSDHILSLVLDTPVWQAHKWKLLPTADLATVIAKRREYERYLKRVGK